MKRAATIMIVLLMLGFLAESARAAGTHGCRRLGVAKTIRCAFNYIGFGGQADYAVRVAGGPTARCPNGESGLHPRAVNGLMEGLFQHNRLYWPGRVARYWWGIGSSIFNYRIQSFVTARMVRHTGWSPWSCA